MAMREILFRGKRFDDGKWVYGWICQYPFGRWPLKWAIIPSEDAIDGYHHFEQIDPATIGQFTGLTDKNGKMIFDGDILLPSKGPLQIHPLVVFLDFSWQMVLPSQKYYRHRLEEKDNGIYEVIGNIHDTPELLEGGGEDG